MSEKIIDMAIIEDAKSTMKDKFPMMVEFFIEDCNDYIKSIKEGINIKDAAKVSSPSHTIKSSAKQLGAMKLSEYAREVEEMALDIKDAKGGDINQLQGLCEKLYSAFGEAETELKKLV